MSESDSNVANFVFGGISILGLVTLSFLAGAYVSEFETFPYPQLLERPFKALRAKTEKAQRDHSPKGSLWWDEVKHDKKGVTRYDESKAFDGFTVYSTHEPGAWLIDMEGNVIHEWRLPFFDAWPDPPHINDPVDEEAIKWSGAKIFPNGDALAIYTAEGDTPYGYGLAKVDKDSNVIWTYSDHVHHDFTVQPDGTIWTLTHQFRDLSTNPVPMMPDKFQGRRVLVDFAVHLSEDGEELERIRLTEAVFGSELGEKVGKWHRGQRWDLLHTNNVEPIPQDFARHHDFAEAGQLLVSFREINTIALVDPESRKVTWYARGFWVKQHDPDPLSNGNILIYDNKGNRGPSGMSRVAEFDPRNGDIVWSYTGTAEDPFATKWGGKQKMLPNGNVLIAENRGSRVLEVNREGEVVWEFYVPQRAKQEGKEYIPFISGRTSRYRKDYFSFTPEANR